MILVILILLSPVHSFAGDKKTDAVKLLEIFEGLCLQNSEEFDNIEKILYDVPKKVALSPEVLAAGNPLLAGRGKGYAFKDDSQVFVISWVENMSCGVTADNVDIKKLKKLIKDNFRVETFDIASEGMQVSESFLFKSNSNYKGGIMVLIYLKNKTNLKGAALNFLPEREFKKVMKK